MTTNRVPARGVLLPEAQFDEVVNAMQDMLNGWRYIRQTHGDLYGVGWDRAEEKMERALEGLTGKPA